MAVEVASKANARTAWTIGTLACTTLPIALVAATAPPSGGKPIAAVTWLLFIGSSMHVAATAWFFTVPEVRTHMARHRTRYVWVPVALVCALAVGAACASLGQRAALLLAYFAWQLVHFQKQNLGLAALAARAYDAGSLTLTERRALVAAGVGGVLGLLGHPALLQVAHARQLDWLFGVGAAVFAIACFVGVRAVLARPATHRPAPFVGVYLTALLFFAPVWIFSSPYAAVAGLTIAHGLQYLLLVGLVAAAPRRGPGAGTALLTLVNVALLLGLALNRMSHLHDAAVFGRALFGVFLGLSAAHFVIDAGLWRLRDEFPREFLTRRLPYLLAEPLSTLARNARD